MNLLISKEQVDIYSIFSKPPVPIQREFKAKNQRRIQAKTVADTYALIIACHVIIRVSF